ncbi:MAG: cytochrome-c peroxidase, partial [Myxococcota bacterium]
MGLTLACDAEEDGPVATGDAGSGDEGGSDDGGSGGDDGDQFFDDAELNTILTWLGPLPPAPAPDPSNAWADDPAAAAFGQKLFFEPGYSENGEVSCATCHDPEAAFDDDRANTSEGIAFTERSSMSVLNGAYAEAAEDAAPWQFWDGRSDSQWSQALGPPENDVEMGSARTTVVLLINDLYAADYENVFGPLPTLHDADGVPLAPAGSK